MITSQAILGSGTDEFSAAVAATPGTQRASLRMAASRILNKPDTIALMNTLRDQTLKAFIHPPILTAERKKEIGRLIGLQYIRYGMRQPAIRWFDSPWAALDVIAKDEVVKVTPRVEGHPDHMVADNRELVEKLQAPSTTRKIEAVQWSMILDAVASAAPTTGIGVTLSTHLAQVLSQYAAELYSFGVAIPMGQVVADAGLMGIGNILPYVLSDALGMKNPTCSSYHRAIQLGLGVWWPFKDRAYLTPMPAYHFDVQERARMFSREMLALTRGPGFSNTIDDLGDDIVEEEDPEMDTTVFRGRTHRLHNEKGPAIRYPDGQGVWAIKGVVVDEQIVMRPKEQDPHRVFAERNIEKRRIMLERFTFERLMQVMEPMDRRTRDAIKRQEHEHSYSVNYRPPWNNRDPIPARHNRIWLVDESEFGKLWQISFRDDEPQKFVQVKNSTPERDGTFRDYFLRVDPDCDTAREAVAWTFGLAEDEYKPMKET